MYPYTCDYTSAMCVRKCKAPAPYTGAHGRHYCIAHRDGVGDCFYVSGCPCCDPHAKIAAPRSTPPLP